LKFSEFAQPVDAEDRKIAAIVTAAHHLVVIVIRTIILEVFVALDH